MAEKLIGRGEKISTSFSKKISLGAGEVVDMARMTAGMEIVEQAILEPASPKSGWFSEAERAPASEAARAIRVLLVEDSDEHAEWIAILASEEVGEGFEFARAATLEQAMRQLMQNPPDVVLLDLGMPELEGYRSYAAVRAVTLNTPVVILTGDESWLSKALTLDSGVRDYLLKSRISPQQLKSALRRAFEGSRKRAE